MICCPSCGARNFKAEAPASKTKAKPVLAGRGTGPQVVAENAIRILASMTGEPVPEETQDVIKDAVWEAFGNGRRSVIVPAPADQSKETDR